MGTEKKDFWGQTEEYRIHNHQNYITINCNGSCSKRKEKKIQDWQLYPCKGIKSNRKCNVKYVLYKLLKL